jgi:hypothetical protein
VPLPFLRNHHRFAGFLSAIICLFPGVARGWSPGIAQPDAVGSPAVPLTVDTQNRNDVVSFYHTIYMASEGGNVEVGWTGNRDGCVAGATTEAFKVHVRRRINWFRAMAGMPADIVFDAGLSASAQAAALIMAKELALSHDPAEDFGTGGCWTQAGETGANRGNLYIGVFGVPSIDGYIDDYGIDTAGHRAWILFPRTTKMGTGDIPEDEVNGLPPTNCLYVRDDGSRRAATARFHSWPPAGFVPASTVYPLWSLQFDTANSGSPTFGSAAVSMTVGATNAVVPVAIRHRYQGGGLAGAPSIVWEPNWSAWGGTPPLETPITVTVSGMAAGASGAATSHSFTVTCIDPMRITEPLVVAGPASVPSTGGTYTFSGLADGSAERYDLGVARVRTGTVVEGAESQPSPRIIDRTSPSYALMAVPGNGLAAQAGQRCFHLALPDFDEWLQEFELDYDMLPGATASLSFDRRLGFMTAATWLRVSVSSEAEPGWKEVWARNGPGGGGWTKESVSLAGFAGKSLRIRFQLEWQEGSAYIGTDSDYGVLIDGITVTGCEYTDPFVVTPLSSATRQFSLDATTAGAALVTGSEWFLRVRATLGLHTFPFAAPFRVTVASPSGGYAGWLAARYPNLTPPGFMDDADGDGMTNGVEYSFGSDPSMSGGGPVGLKSENGSWILSFDPASLPYPVTDIIYEAEASGDLNEWSKLTDEPSGSRHVFRLPDGPAGYARWRISLSP